jgi:hypothetical protein
VGNQKRDLDRTCKGALLSGAALWLALGLVLTLRAPIWGQNVAQPSWRGLPALASRGHPGLALLSHDVPEVQGQDALATAGVLQEPASLGGGLPVPTVTVERHGRLLVLTYGPKSTGGALMSNAGPRGEPPGFTVYKGQRKVASGQFEYG